MELPLGWISFGIHLRVQHSSQNSRITCLIDQMDNLPPFHCDGCLLLLVLFLSLCTVSHLKY